MPSSFDIFAIDTPVAFMKATGVSMAKISNELGISAYIVCKLANAGGVIAQSGILVSESSGD